MTSAPSSFSDDAAATRRVAVPTSVQPPETNPPDNVGETAWGTILTSDDLPVIFRHSGWKHERASIRQALIRTYASPRSLQRFDLCGADPWVAVDANDPQNLTILTNHCHSRWCVPCSRERANRIIGNMLPKVKEAPCRFLTLTMKHSDTPLAAQIDRIYSSFRLLRRSPNWNRYVTGGAAVLEIKHGWKDDLWHVHLHCLIHGQYIPHRLLKADWWRITRDSNIVDIRPVPNAAAAAKYIVKYITKPIPNTLINKPDLLDELISACRRRRLVLTWGTWRGLKLSAKLGNTEWRVLCPLDTLYARRDDGDLNAFIVICALEKVCPEAPDLLGRPPPPLPSDTHGLDLLTAYRHAVQASLF